MLVGPNEVMTNAFYRLRVYLLRGVGEASTLVNSKGNVRSSVVCKVIQHANNGLVIETPLFMGFTVSILVQNGNSRSGNGLCIGQPKSVDNTRNQMWLCEMEGTGYGGIRSKLDTQIVFHGADTGVIINIKLAVTEVLDDRGDDGIIITADNGVVHPKQENAVLS